MIGRLTGKLAGKHPPQVLVDCNGVAYELDVPMSTFYNLPAVGDPVTLHTHLVVREDIQALYGFGTLEERAAFRQLLKISGVGARTALSRALGPVGGRAGTGGGPAGSGPAHQDPGHRQEDRRAPAAGAQGQARGREANRLQAGPRTCSTPCWGWVTARRRRWLR